MANIEIIDTPNNGLKVRYSDGVETQLYTKKFCDRNFHDCYQYTPRPSNGFNKTKNNVSIIGKTQGTIREKVVTSQKNNEYLTTGGNIEDTNAIIPPNTEISYKCHTLFWDDVVCDLYPLKVFRQHPITEQYEIFEQKNSDKTCAVRLF